MTAVADEIAPMLEMNTTPLIDVMLVLLVMMIITIPPQSHAVKIDLPTSPPRLMPDPLRNRLVITAAGGLLWNGEAVTQRELRPLLRAAAAMDPSPELQFHPNAAARYAVVDEVLAMSKQAGVTSMGFVGNQDHARAF